MSFSGPDHAAVAIVDDDASVRRALDRLLRSVGYAVVAYGSGEQFLQSLAYASPSCSTCTCRR